MNTEKLNTIVNLIDEGKAYKAHIDGMDAECKSIQQYCLDAIQDFHDTFCAVCELIEKNPHIANWTDGNSAWLGNSSLAGGTGFQYNKAKTDCGVRISYISMDECKSMGGLFTCFRLGSDIQESKIVKVKQIISNTKGKNLEQWLIVKNWANETRKMSATLLESMRISAEKYRKNMKETLDKGISEGAKKYEKVA